MALVGQMYHLPADWPAGALLVALGGLIAAVLMRSNGALAIALIAICAWSGGRWEEARSGAHLGFFILYLPALWLSLSRDNRLVHHLVVLAAAAWLAMAPGYGLSTASITGYWPMGWRSPWSMLRWARWRSNGVCPQC